MQKGRIRTWVVIRCQCCGNPFMPSYMGRRKQKFCSGKCRVYAGRGKCLICSDNAISSDTRNRNKNTRNSETIDTVGVE